MDPESRRLSERAGTVDTDTNSVAAQMAAAGTAVAAVAARDVPFARHAVADRQAANLGAHLNDAAAIFVADGHRDRDGLLGPGVPLVNVHVGAADRGLGDLDQHIVRADLGLRYIVQPDAGGCFFLYKCLQEMTPSSLPTVVNASSARSS